jgi:hypothetical protein
MVDVSSVRNILSRIRKVVTGDIILPEDHNLQTDAIAKLADIVETISPGAAAEIPIVFPFPQLVSVGQLTPHIAGAFQVAWDTHFIMPFTVKLKKWFFWVTYNDWTGNAIITLLDNDDPIASVTVPVGQTGTYSIPLNDYVLYEGHDFRVQVTPTVSEWYRYLGADSMWVLAVLV